MPDGDHLLIGLHHPHGAAMTRFKRETNLQGWDGCSTRHDGLLAAVMSDSQEAAPSGVGPPETRHHSQVEVVSVEYSSRTLPKSWQLCRKCTDTALWRSIVCRIEDGFVHVACFQPCVEDGFVHRDMAQQPWVADFVKAGFDVSFQYPLRSRAIREHRRALLHCIRTTPFLPKPIRVWVGQCFDRCPRHKGGTWRIPQHHGADVIRGQDESHPCNRRL